MATKITNNLQIKNLFPTKAGGVIDVEGFKKFVEDGELLTLINECAEAIERAHDFIGDLWLDNEQHGDHHPDGTFNTGK